MNANDSESWRAGKLPRSFASARPVAALLFAFALFSWGAPARAWVEMTVLSDDVLLEVARDGSAVVSHEMLMRLRGRPLTEWTLEGVDTDAEPLPDATLTLARSGKEAGLPMPLALQSNDGRLVAKILYKEGVRRGGTYIARVRYRTDFAKSSRIRAAGSAAEIRWQSPEFQSGIDSMRVVFRLPAAERAPELPDFDRTSEGVGIAEEFGGVFLSTLRRGSGHDDLEIVRPHVAKAERVTWRARVDPEAFDLPLGVLQVSASPERTAPALRSVTGSPLQHPLAAWGAGACAFVYGLLVALKARGVRRVCERVRAIPRPFLPLPVWTRALLGGGALGAAAVFASSTEHPSVAGLLLVLAILACVHSSPAIKAALRGPGRWTPMPAGQAFRMPRAPKAPGGMLDAGTPLGFAFFLLSLGAFLAMALFVARHSVYHGVAVALFAACLFPLFCTGRASDLPRSGIDDARRLLLPIYLKLKRDPALKVSPLVRVPEGSADPDELRLGILPKAARRGLEAIEVGYDYQRGFGGALPVPYVIVRILDGSPAAEALPKGLLWTRGRTADERVVVLRPRLPTRALSLSLVRRLVCCLSAEGTKAVGKRQSPTSARSSGGSPSSTVNAGTRASPAHAT